MRIFSRLLGRWRGAVVAGLGIGLYTLLVGAQASVAGRRPSPETLQVLQGYTLQRTNRNGWIELTTDGEQMWVEVERK